MLMLNWKTNANRSVVMEKVIRDGLVAVLYSPGFGAGWFTWNMEDEQILFHPKIVAMVESGRRNELTKEWVLENLGIDIYTGGAENLQITWLREGQAFRIEEYDGSESVITVQDLVMIA